MNSLRLFDRKAASIVAVIALAVAAVVPAIVSAAQLTERSIELSSSSASAENVSYQINFTSVDVAGAFVVDFCSNTPVIGEACTAPTGLDLTAATSATVGFTGVSDLSANTVRVTGTIGAATEISVQLDDITNPSTVGPMYARIVTYDTETNADNYDSEALGTGAVDDGGAAVSITDTIGVSGAVLETMTFCVSGGEIDADCTNTTSPVIALGETVGDVVALTPSAVSEGSIYTQISTNAEGGAVVSLKSSAEGCGGLIRAGAPTDCDILPALVGDITAGQARFGVKTATATDTVGVADATGAFQPVSGSGYNDTTFALNYILGDATGVTSVFGDPFLDTDSAPANNKNMQLTFGASISNDTPAGLYSADMSLIATGRF